MSLRIPESLQPTLERLASLSGVELEKIREAFSAIPAHVKPEVMAERVSASPAAKDIPDLADIFRGLASLTISRFRADAPLDEFVHSLSETLSEKLRPEDRTAFEEKLKTLLDVDTLVVSARAFDIQHEYEKIFRAGRIMTDIRPVFNPTGSEIVGAMIVHNLSIGYSQEGRFKEIVIAMDDADLASLRKIIDRAETKVKTSEKLISKAGIQYFESK